MGEAFTSFVFPWISSFLYYATHVVITLLFLVALLYVWIRPKYVDPSIPGPKRDPWLGTTFNSYDDFLPNGGEGFNWELWPTLSLKFSRHVNFMTWGGPTINIGFGGAFFNVVSPQCLEHILIKNHENYVKGKLIRSFMELFGEMAFTTDGDLWKFHRKVAVAILNRETTKQGNRILQYKLKQVEEQLLQKQHKPQHEQTIDFQDLSYKLIMDVFVKLGFDVDLNGVVDSTSTDDTKQNNKQHIQFMNAFNELQSLINDRFVDLFWEIKQRFRLGAREQRIHELTQVIDGFAETIIKEIRANNEKENVKTKQDIISRFICHCQEQKEPIPSNRELRNMMMGFIMAGRDTTAASLSWTIYELNQHPEHKAALRKELQAITGENSSAPPDVEDLTVDLLQQLPYLNAVVMESLRLHPTAPDNYRFSKKDDVLPDGTKVPGGSLVMFSPYTINHCENIWENPDEFDPIRFLVISDYESKATAKSPTMKKRKEPSPLLFPTFNAGPRTCPGQSLALMELKMCLAFLLSRFDFTDEERHSGEYTWKLVMSMKGGYPVRVVPFSDGRPECC